jgi:hypothetical protein
MGRSTPVCALDQFVIQEALPAYALSSDTGSRMKMERRWLVSTCRHVDSATTPEKWARVAVVLLVERPYPPERATHEKLAGTRSVEATDRRAARVPGAGGHRRAAPPPAPEDLGSRQAMVDPLASLDRGARARHGRCGGPRL